RRRFRSCQQSVRDVSRPVPRSRSSHQGLPHTARLGPVTPNSRKFFLFAFVLLGVDIFYFLAGPHPRSLMPLSTSASHLSTGIAAGAVAQSTSPRLVDVLSRPVSLREGIGRAHEPVTTTSPRAQAFYDQGLAYLHSFVWIEAAR